MAESATVQYIQRAAAHERVRLAYNAFLHGTPARVAFATLPAGDHLDPVLTERAQNFVSQAFISNRVAPVLSGLPPAATYERWLKGSFFANEAGPRGDNALARRVNLRSETVSYATNMQAARADIGDRQMRLLGPAAADNYGTMIAMEALMLRRERQTAAIAMLTTSWTSNEDVAGLWARSATLGTNTVVEDVEGAKATIRARTGLLPNVLAMDYDTFSNLSQDATVLARIQLAPSTANVKMVTAQLLAQLFSLDEVIVGQAIYNSAPEEFAGDNFTAADIWEANAGKGSALLFYRSSTPSIASPSAMYAINSVGPIMDTYFLRETLTTAYEAYEETAYHVTAPDLGHLFTDTIVT